MQGLASGMATYATASAVASQADLLILGQALDIQVQQISGMGMLITQHRRAGMQIAPSTEMGATQDAADGGGTDAGLASNQVAGAVGATQLDNLFEQGDGSGSGAAMWAGGAVQQRGRGVTTIARHPLGGGFAAHAEGGCSRLQGLFLLDNFSD